MVWHIIRKELLVNILSLRFLIGFLIVVLMMGLVGFVLVKDYTARRDTYLSDVERHREGLKQTKVYSTIEVVADFPPSPLSVFSRGVRDLPTSIHVSPYHIPSLTEEGESGSRIEIGETSNRPYNPLLRVFASIDLTFVISTILSLFAILLVFDSFSGEREQGTLKLLLSSPTGRLQLLTGKFLGALLTLAIPLTVGFLEIMTLWFLSPGVTLDATYWAGFGLIYLFSLVFLAGFLALGLLVSLFARESSSGLMYLLLAWVLVAIVIPAGVGYLAEYARPQESGKKLMEGLEKQFSETTDKVKYQQKGPWWYASTDRTGSESILSTTKEEIYNRIEYNKNVFPLKFQYAADRYRLLEDYAMRLLRWKQMRDALTRPSLCVLYRNIVEAISATDIESYANAVKSARNYRDALMNYLTPKVQTAAWFTRVLDYPELEPTEENMKSWNKIAEKEGQDVFYTKILTWDRVAPLDLRDMPQPQIALPSLAERLSQPLIDALILIGLTALFFILSLWKALRYRVF
ncbi:MAG: ABC transporter permease subunit [Bacteroidota bacterium]|jgi:ABC-type transport system involved in multi-copper enzyme maturation permease subunit